MRKSLVTIAAAAGLATMAVSGLNAQGGAPAALDPSAAQAGSYTADAGHSMVVWSLSHLGFNDYFGIFGDVSGTLNIDPADIGSASVDVMIPIASVTVPSAGLKDHLLRAGADGAAPDFFGPSPEAAHFVSTSVHSTGATTAEIMGDLTFNGVTKPVTVQAELSGMGTNGMTQKATLGFHGTTTINRSEFDLGWGIPFGIEDAVDLDITIAFEKD